MEFEEDGGTGFGGECRPGMKCGLGGLDSIVDVRFGGECDAGNDTGINGGVDGKVLGCGGYDLFAVDKIVNESRYGVCHNIVCMICIVVILIVLVLVSSYLKVRKPD